jgi:regulator of nonsense transcripts 1
MMRGAQRVVLIGDHMQLPPTILSTQARDDGYAMSLFEKLVLAHGEWSIMLDVQRRMHPCVAAFPGRAFYGDRIRSADCTWDEAFIDGFKWPNGNRVVCVNSNGWEERRGVSSINRDEAYAVAALIPRIQLEQAEIGIITPYLAQKNLILELLAKHHNMLDIKVDTVDGFQGSEREVIVYSCVRSNERGALGFLSDYRRLNVAITRARKGLVVIGNIATLESYGEESSFGQYDDRRYWRQWIKWCRQMDLVKEVKDLQL